MTTTYLAGISRAVRDNRGQVSFWAVVGIMLLCAAYLIHPQVFHDFVTFLTDFLFDTLDKFMGGESQKPGTNTTPSGK
jgi:hypothetical protein